MKKKIMVIVMCLFLSSTVFFPLANSENNFDKKNFDNDMSFNEDNNNNEEILARCPRMLVDASNFFPKEESPKPDPVNVPSTFSWKDYNGQDWTSPAKNQGNCGSCWAFGAISVLETIINIREGYANLDADLSEQYIMSCLPEAGGCFGGGSYLAFALMMETSPEGNYHNGALVESCFPYRGIDVNGCNAENCNHNPVLCSEKCEDWLEYLVPLSDYGFWSTDGSEMDREAIKTQIYHSGPVVAFIKSTNDFSLWGAGCHDPEQYYPYPGYVSGTNHCVELVGWKDDDSIGNGGYWIVKNSWGTFWGYEGFFNIEYGSLNIDSSGIVFVDYEAESFDWAPVANAGGPYAGHVGEELVFDSSGSFDCEQGTPTSFFWDFGDGSTSTQQSPSHVYDERGVYSVVLTVTDILGQQDSVETAVLVDVWLVDESWSFSVDEISVVSSDGSSIIAWEGTIEDIELTVVEETSDSYRVSFDAKLDGQLDATVAGFELDGKLSRFTRINGEALFDKSDLGLIGLTLQLKGFSKIKMNNFFIPILIPFNVNVDAEFDESFDYLDFPIGANEIWDIPQCSVTFDGEIRSFWLNVLNVINSALGLFDKDFLSTEIASLLPRVCISEALNLWGMSNVMALPQIANIEVGSLESRTVEAGTFDAYGIEVFDMLTYWYAPDVGNIIEISFEMEDSISLHAEMTSTNYGQ